ncbi:MAG: flagellar biosynthetic protein FliR [Sphingomonas sp.]|uniref:flagellar biosynthetic protein FliR n=1 Tax=Sphingomonas sp. CBMAI 2297 TaxID=2991720 RepID=UPI002457CA0E|nr:MULTISPECIES: flagellar biosynthetic protein FliR [unclassified Sphingomonas]MBQ1497746.1 flagellar biosynthetic protein FliR [Sphingomonas sp.]MDH4746381.1 flagellar biosynthetic protein FliR [Sphingomonas sp. CBMAI 2297]
MMGFGLSIEPQLWALLFAMVRIGAAFVAAPVFSAVAIPLPARIALTGAIGVLVMNVAHIAPPAEIFSLATFLAIAAEALIGLAMGFVLQVAFAAPMVASEVISMSMGLGFANAVDPASGHATPAIGTFLSLMLTLIFLSLDGHLVLVDLVVRSYQVMPPGAWIAPERLLGIAMFGGYTFLAGLLLSLPIGFLLLCLNLIVGMLSRAAPALNLFAVGLPASLLFGVVALLLALPAMGDYLVVIIREALAMMPQLVLG